MLTDTKLHEGKIIPLRKHRPGRVLLAMSESGESIREVAAKFGLSYHYTAYLIRMARHRRRRLLSEHADRK
jgi:hypothetical protein